MKQLSIQLPEDLIDAIQAKANQDGIDSDAIIQMALQVFLNPPQLDLEQLQKSVAMADIMKQWLQTEDAQADVDWEQVESEIKKDFLTFKELSEIDNL